MNCVQSTSTVEDIIKKSRFIAILIPCQSENDVLRQLGKLQKEYADASHLVFAYRIKSSTGVISKFHDAGEPGGTAGKPVFQQLAGKDLINLLCVVVRYFGGTKLGAGGLTRAYGNAAKKVIEASTLSEYIEYAEIKLELDYKNLKELEYQLKKFNGSIISQYFAEKISLIIKIPEKNVAPFAKAFKVSSH